MWPKIKELLVLVLELGFYLRKDVYAVLSLNYTLLELLKGPHPSNNIKFHVVPFLFDATLKHMFGCYQNLDRANRDQGTGRLLRNKRHVKVKELTPHSVMTTLCNDHTL